MNLRHSSVCGTTMAARPLLVARVSVALGWVARVALAATASGCMPAAPQNGVSEQQLAVLRAVVDQVALPDWQRAVEATTRLRDAVDAFAGNPSVPQWVALGPAWRAVRLAYRALDALSFGPVDDLRLTASIEQFPIDEAKIAAALADTLPLTVSEVAAFGANKKGTYALEYLLFRPDAELLARTGPQAARVQAYLVGLAHALADDTAHGAAAWQGEPGFAAALRSPPNAQFDSAKRAIDALVNESVYLVETLQQERVGKPLGHSNGGTVDPLAAQAQRSRNTAAELRVSLQGLAAVYVGDPAGIEATCLLTHACLGLTALVRTQYAAVDDEVRATLMRTSDALAALGDDFTAVLSTDPARVQAAYAALGELRQVLGADVVSVLGTTLKFNDNDGD